jgi:hypothetical protein
MAEKNLNKKCQVVEQKKCKMAKQKKMAEPGSELGSWVG